MRHFFALRAVTLPALALGLLSATLQAEPAADALTFRQYNGTHYVSGGVGEDERQAIGEVGKDFNLKLLFAEKEGAYLADVDVLVSNAKGAKVLETHASGPFLLAKLPAGKYRVVASSSGKAQDKLVAVSASQRKTVVFYW